MTHSDNPRGDQRSPIVGLATRIVLPSLSIALLIGAALPGIPAVVRVVFAALWILVMLVALRTYRGALRSQARDQNYGRRSLETAMEPESWMHDPSRRCRRLPHFHQ